VEFTLRDFRTEDFDMLWSIDQKCFAPGIAYSRRELFAYIHRRRSFTVVAEKVSARMLAEAGLTSGLTSSGIVGFIVAEGNRGVGHIISIDVVPEGRRLGLGSKLLLAAEDRLRALHCQSVVLETAVDNASALAFYKRHQYSIMKIVPRYYSNGVDAFVLEKQLSLEQEVVRQRG
jgi:ribosomal-protein-alanine N-acetyltransferase